MLSITDFLGSLPTAGAVRPELVPFIATTWLQYAGQAGIDTSAFPLEVTGEERIRWARSHNLTIGLILTRFFHQRSGQHRSPGGGVPQSSRPKTDLCSSRIRLCR